MPSEVCTLNISDKINIITLNSLAANIYFRNVDEITSTSRRTDLDRAKMA